MSLARTDGHTDPLDETWHNRPPSKRSQLPGRWRYLPPVGYFQPSNAGRMGVNARLFDNVDIAGLRIRYFDGADTWKFLD